LYAADLNNHRIRKVTIGVGADNGDIVTLAGAATAGHVDGTGGAARFEGPNGIVVDPTTHLIYVADGSTIRVVTPTGEVSTLVGSTAAFLDGDGCTAKFTGLKSITKYANELYVVDVQRIRKIVLN
jgi:DNA-binding beta-propeller fold protein YncE